MFSAKTGNDGQRSVLMKTAMGLCSLGIGTTIYSNLNYTEGFVMEWVLVISHLSKIIPPPDSPRGATGI